MRKKGYIYYWLLGLLFIFTILFMACDIGVQQRKIPYDATITIVNILEDEHAQFFVLSAVDDQETYTVNDFEEDHVEEGRLEYIFHDLKGRATISLAIHNQEIKDMNYVEVESQEVHTRQPYATFELEQSFVTYSAIFLILDEEDNPLEGATILVDEEMMATNADGLASFEGLLPGTYPYSVSKEGYEDLLGEVGILDQDINLTLYLEEERERYNLSFLIFDEENHPVEGATILVDEEMMTTNANGLASFARLLPGTYPYSVSKEGYEDLLGEVEILDQDINLTLYLEEERERFSLSFLIFDEEDHPLEGAMVTLQQEERTTDNEGVAIFSGLLPGEYDYSVNLEGYVEKTGSVTISDKDEAITISLELATYSITFLIFDEEDNPLEGAMVSFQEEEVAADANGQVLFQDILPGSYGYSVTKEGYVELEGELDVINQNVEKTIYLQPITYTVTFYVYDDSDEAPLEGANVNLQGEELATDSNGQAIFQAILPGSYDYSISKEAYEEFQGQLNVIDQDVEKNIYLELSTYTVTFYVLDNDDYPLEGAEIHFNNEEQLTDTNGMTEFHEVLPGTLSYTITKERYKELSEEITLLDQDIEVTHKLELLTYNVTFHVQDYNEIPLEGALVLFNNEEKIAGANGLVLFQRILPGEYGYSVTLDEYANEEGLLTVADENAQKIVTLIGLEFAAGEGTSQSPYLIKNPTHLNNLRDHLSSHFQLIGDIDLDGFGDQDRGWLPIGSESEPFQGRLDGQGYSILNLFIRRPQSSNIGLFGYLDGGELKNIHLEDTSVRGDERVGGLVGHNRNGTIKDSSANGRVEGTSIIGGLVGRNSGTGKIDNCSADIRTIGYLAFVGGLAGYNEGDINRSHASGRINSYGEINNNSSIGGLVGYNTGYISNSYATGNAQGVGRNVGGLVGENQDGEIHHSYAKGNVTSNKGFVGGFVGRHYENARIQSSFATGDVEGGERYVGGFAGSTSFRASILECYATGDVKGPQFVGSFIGTVGEITTFDGQGYISECYATGSVTGGEGLIGYFDNGSVNNSYYDKERSGLDVGTGKGIAKTTEEMMREETFKEWDFNLVWTIIEGESYPFFLWQGGEHIPSPF